MDGPDSFLLCCSQNAGEYLYSFLREKTFFAKSLERFVSLISLKNSEFMSPVFLLHLK